VKNRINCIIPKLTLAAIIAGLTIWLALPAWQIPSASAQTADGPAALSALQGERAIDQLKEQGLYDSLQEAVAAARYEKRWEDRPALNHLPAAYHAPNPAQRLSATFTPSGLHLGPHKTMGEVGAAAQQAQLIPPFFNLVNGQPDYQNGGEGFGRSVAISGETAVVGVPSDDVTAWNQGSAYVFVRNGATWSQQARLIPSNVAADYWFGYSVAIYGDTVVVGMPEYFPNNAGPGSAYVFVRNGATWSQQARLTPSNGTARDFFGHSVAISGNTVVVGAPYDSIGANALQGSAYVFVRSGITWSEEAQLIASDGTEPGFFGYSVAISGNTLVAGAIYARDVGDNTVQGAAYVFERSGASWTELQKLMASDGASYDFFGNSVAISGNTVVVGASGDDIGTHSNQGSAYVFVRYGFGQSFSRQLPKLTANDGAAEDQFGSAVAINGNTVAVGAPQDDVFVNNVMQDDHGSVYIFTRSGTTWGQTQKLNASGQASNLPHDQDRFGSAVALGSGSITTLVAGAPNDTVVYHYWFGQPAFVGRTGSAYIFVM
jgi:hypothetical protein